MNLIKITTQFIQLEGGIYDRVILRKGKTYLIRREHAEWIENLRLGLRVDGLSQLSHLAPEHLKRYQKPAKVLFLFHGGMGDAIALAVLLQILQVTYNLEYDVACKYEIWTDVLRPMSCSGNWVQVPVELETLKSYDYIQTRGDRFLSDTTEMTSKCILEELALSYNVSADRHGVTYVISDSIRRKSALPETKRLRLGVNFNSNGAVKSYPSELQPRLLKGIVDLGFEVFVFGHKAPNLPKVNVGNSIHNYCGKTAVPELAALVSQMDLMVGVDSFIVHLSDILKIPTIVLLSVTRKGMFSLNTGIITLESKIGCTPCNEVHGPCPKGYAECKAFFHESISPEMITTAITKQCARLLFAKIEKAQHVQHICSCG